MTTPVAGVKYRIQSVDISDKCLELLNPSSLATVVKLRPLKEINSQYWQFVQVPSTAYYYVQNVESSDRYLNYSSGSLVAGSNTSSSSYTTPSHQSDNVYRLVISSNSYYLTTDDSLTVSLTSTLSTSNPNSQNWQLIPVTVHPVNNQELKSGAYRIRNINGRDLLTMPSQESVGDTGVYAGSQLEKDDEIAYQRWTVTSQSSGDYTIQNIGTNTYLGCRTDSLSVIVGDGLVGLSSVFSWNLQSIGGFAWSLRLPATELSIGVADYDIEDNDEVSLVPSDATSSQIWFIEKYYPLGEEKIHAKREIIEGKYHLQCVHDQTIYMVAFASPLRITAKTISDPTKVSTDASKFELKYIDTDSAHFTLTWATTATSPAPIVADRGGYLGMNSTGTEFVLLEKNTDDPGYFICRPELGRPHKVVSNRTKLDDDGNSVFAIDNITPGEALQMWKFVSAS